MPHSTSLDAPLHTNKMEDIDLPHAPVVDAMEDTKKSEESDGADTDSPATLDVKLEDLFNDDDEEDEEFPTSINNKVKVESSPPPVPM